MLGRVGHRGRVEHPRGALRDVAIDLAGLDGSLGAEQGLEFRALGDVARPVDAPHQVGEFLILREHQREVARPAGVPSAANGLPVEEPSSTIDL